MKFKLWQILILTFIFFQSGLNCKKETENQDCKSRYSYSSSVKIPLTEIPNAGIICFYNKPSYDSLNKFLSRFSEIKYLSNSSNGNWISISINSESCPKTDLLFAKINEDPRVSNCNKFLVTQTGSQFGILDKVICKLKLESTWEKVYELIITTNTTVIEYSPNTRTLIVNVDKNSEGDALDIANGLFESGFFEWTEAEIIDSSYRTTL